MLHSGQLFWSVPYAIKLLLAWSTSTEFEMSMPVSIVEVVSYPFCKCSLSILAYISYGSKSFISLSVLSYFYSLHNSIIQSSRKSSMFADSRQTVSLSTSSAILFTYVTRHQGCISSHSHASVLARKPGIITREHLVSSSAAKFPD